MFNPLTTNDEYGCHETFIHFQQCPLELGSLLAERLGQGEVGVLCLGLAIERP